MKCSKTGILRSCGFCNWSTHLRLGTLVIQSSLVTVRSVHIMIPASGETTNEVSVSGRVPVHFLKDMTDL